MAFKSNTIKVADFNKISNSPHNEKFIPLKSFYSFIKSNGNIPLDSWYFSVSFFYPQGNYNLGDVVINFNRLRMLIQSISFPETLEIKGTSDDTGKMGDGILDLSTIHNGYSGLRNSFVHPSSHTVVMSILETNIPIIENFIYNWMKDAVSSDFYDNTTIFTKASMAVKFWSPDRVAFDNIQEISPNFVYYLTSLYPVKIKVVKPDMSFKGESTRMVTFAFNDFVILTSNTDCTNYGLPEFFTDNLGEKTVYTYEPDPPKTSTPSDEEDDEDSKGDEGSEQDKDKKPDKKDQVPPPETPTPLNGKGSKPPKPDEDKDQVPPPTEPLSRVSPFYQEDENSQDTTSPDTGDKSPSAGIDKTQQEDTVDKSKLFESNNLNGLSLSYQNLQSENGPAGPLSLGVKSPVDTKLGVIPDNKESSGFDLNKFENAMNSYFRERYDVSNEYGERKSVRQVLDDFRNNTNDLLDYARDTADFFANFDEYVREAVWENTGFTWKGRKKTDVDSLIPHMDSLYPSFDYYDYEEDNDRSRSNRRHNEDHGRDEYSNYGGSGRESGHSSFSNDVSQQRSSIKQSIQDLQNQQMNEESVSNQQNIPSSQDVEKMELDESNKLKLKIEIGRNVDPLNLTLAQRLDIENRLKTTDDSYQDPVLRKLREQKMDIAALIAQEANALKEEKKPSISQSDIDELFQ